MSLVAAGLAPFPAYPMIWSVAGDGGGDIFTFDSAADALSLVFRIPKTGTIDKIHYRMTANPNTCTATHRIELRTVNTTTGIPNAAGTLYGSSTSITVPLVLGVGYTANTNVTAAVNATGATAGDLAAVVFDFSAYTVGTINQMCLQNQTLTGFSVAAGSRASVFPYSVLNTAAANVLSPLPMMAIALEYSGGEFVPILPGIGWVGTAATDQTINSGSFQRVGNAFTPAVPRRAVGFYAMADIDGVASFQLRLASDSSILATATVDKDLRGTTAVSPQYFQFDGAPVTLAAGTKYYVLLEGGDATGGILYGLGSGVSTAMLNTMPGGQNCVGVSYNGTVYAEKTTANAVRRYFIGLITDQEDDGVGGGATAANTISIRSDSNNTISET